MENPHNMDNELCTNNEYEIRKTQWSWALGLLAFTIFVLGVIIIEIKGI